MPTITAITQQKKLKDRFSVFVDGKFELGLAGSLITKYDIKVGDVYTDKLKGDLENDDFSEMAYTRLLNYLAYRERCEYEVNQWLFRKGYQDLKDDLVARLKDHDYLNDARYARLFIRDRVKLKGWGPIRLRHELNSKRIDKGIIDVEIESIKDDSDFDQLALDLVLRKTKNLAAPNFNDKKRLWSLLKRHGFETSTINAALSQINFRKNE